MGSLPKLVLNPLGHHKISYPVDKSVQYKFVAKVPVGCIEMVDTEAPAHLSGKLSHGGLLSANIRWMTHLTICHSGWSVKNPNLITVAYTTEKVSLRDEHYYSMCTCIQRVDYRCVRCRSPSLHGQSYNMC
jgi:hypothetical protein